MFVIVAVKAEVFPVRSVLGVVVMISVLMMNSQEVPVLTLELSAALGTDEAMDS